MKEWLKFFRRLVRNPRAVGAITPSSQALAKSMVAQIDPSRAGRILELGPGTGAITRALIDRGFEPSRITAVEADHSFARLIRERFPEVEVLEGDAFDPQHLRRAEQFSAVVSGIPLLNYPRHHVLDFIETVLSHIPRGAPFIQFSYGPRPPVPRSSRIRVALAATIWRNVPPAKIWVFRAA